MTANDTARRDGLQGRASAWRTAGSVPDSTGNPHNSFHVIGDVPDEGPAAIAAPSRGRDPGRLAKAVAAGEQPTGRVGMPLVPGGAGPVLFLEDMVRIKHPLEAPPPLPWRLQDAMDCIGESPEEEIMAYRDGIMQRIRGMAADLEETPSGVGSHNYKTT